MTTSNKENTTKKTKKTTQKIEEIVKEDIANNVSTSDAQAQIEDMGKNNDAQILNCEEQGQNKCATKNADANNDMQSQNDNAVNDVVSVDTAQADTEILRQAQNDYIEAENDNMQSQNVCVEKQVNNTDCQCEIGENQNDSTDTQNDYSLNENDLIVLRDVCKAYDGQNVVDNVNLTIKKGEFVTFLGPSGCGKTTTLRMIAGFEKPTSGEILLDGKSVLDIPPHLRPVNTVFQRYALFPHLNVFDNIAFGLKMKRKELCKDVKGFLARRKAIKMLISEKVKKALKIVGLTDYEYRNVTSLSGGQQQRVAIARAIVNEPQVLLLDEPLGALDLKMRQEMQLELKNMHRRLGITFVYVTHDQEEALTMSDRIVIMKNGIIHQVGTPIDIYNEPTNAFVADFIGESNIINGIMIKDKLVRFAGTEFVCVDGGFEKNQAIDVVIRPEDIYLMDEEKGQIKGVVISSLFKGVHYEMSVIANKVEFLIHSTTEWKAGERVSLFIRPDDIHIMKKEKNSNVITAKVLNESEIEFADGVFNYDKATFEKAGFAENDYLKEEVKVSIDFDKIDLTDYEDSAPIAGNIVSSIFKGDKYQYVVKSDNGFDFFVDTEDEYDSNDRVGITIKPEDIKLIKIVQTK